MSYKGTDSPQELYPLDLINCQRLQIQIPSHWGQDLTLEFLGEADIQSTAERMLQGSIHIMPDELRKSLYGQS